MNRAVSYLALTASSLSLLSALAGAETSRSVDISKSGWRLWLDAKASWENDPLFLPSEVQLSKLPVNPPTGGWQALNGRSGIPVTLPTTVEEHYWGKLGTRPYNQYEAQRGPVTSFPNGNYKGVSWWHRSVQIPKFKPGQRVALSVRGARLRAEVYCNGKLCAYSIMGELPFEADLTDAVKPGETAQVAIRITNPGGHFDWLDFGSARMNWGKYTFPPTRGFGGLDEDIQLTVRDAASVADLAAINTPDLHKVKLLAQVTNRGKPYRGLVRFEIAARKGGKVWSGTAPVELDAGETKSVAVEAQVDKAEPWDLQHPNLYQASASLSGLSASDRRTSFGFRYFTPSGIGSDDAILTLNGKRIVLRSAISWGFWGRNGLWPDAEMAEREVVNAQKIGLNCLQFHRNVGKPEVLDIQDEKGLLRFEEPGAGKFAIGTRYSLGPFGPNGEFPKGDANDALDAPKSYVEPESVDTSGAGPDGDGKVFWEKYEEEKILQMVKRDRSHPSLIAYTIQNESSSLDLRNPRIYRILREMHALDPSRLITFFSGGDPRIAQVTMLPYSEEIMYGSKSIAYAGWRDVHTCGGPCTYLDNLYQDPTHFTQLPSEKDYKEICVWGETLGAATPDDYDKLVHSFDDKHPNGYELDDMKKILAGYHDYVEKYGFRQAFPTDSSLFQAIGYRTYYFWKRIVEQSRFANANDMLVISGWESTSIDNHSGIVDNHRFFKGDPSVIAEACQPEMLVIQPRKVIVAKGDKDLIDVYLVNETNRTGPQTLSLMAKRPDGSVAFKTEKPVTAIGGNTFGHLLAEAIEIPADAAGMMTLEATLTPASKGAGVLKKTDQVEVLDVVGGPIYKNVAIVEPEGEVGKTLSEVFGVTASKFSDASPSQRLDAIVLAPKTQKSGPSDVDEATWNNALERVKNDGTRLVLWPDDNFRAESFVRMLEKSGIAKSGGNVGNLGAPWFGSWFFVRKHWLLDGLPTDCAMDWRYGVSAFSGPAWLKDSPGGSNTDGFLIDAPGLEAVVGFGADHNTKVGTSGCVIPYGKGKIVFYCLPQIVRSLQPGDWATNMQVCRRLLGNALRVRSAVR